MLWINTYSYVYKGGIKCLYPSYARTKQTSPKCPKQNDIMRNAHMQQASLHSPTLSRHPKSNPFIVFQTLISLYVPCTLFFPSNKACTFSQTCPSSGLSLAPPKFICHTLAHAFLVKRKVNIPCLAQSPTALIPFHRS